MSDGVLRVHQRAAEFLAPRRARELLQPTMMKALSMLAMAAIARGTPEMNKLPNGDTKVRPPTPVPASGMHSRRRDL